jgi:hypothetical protein
VLRAWSSSVAPPGGANETLFFLNREVVMDRTRSVFITLKADSTEERFGWNWTEPVSGGAPCLLLRLLLSRCGRGSSPGFMDCWDASCPLSSLG